MVMPVQLEESRNSGDLIPGKACNNIDKDLFKTFLDVYLSVTACCARFT